MTASISAAVRQVKVGASAAMLHTLCVGIPRSSSSFNCGKAQGGQPAENLQTIASCLQAHCRRTTRPHSSTVDFRSVRVWLRTTTSIQARSQPADGTRVSAVCSLHYCGEEDANAAAANKAPGVVRSTVPVLGQTHNSSIDRTTSGSCTLGCVQLAELFRRAVRIALRGCLHIKCGRRLYPLPALPPAQK